MPSAWEPLALVHDYLTEYGGAERVLEAFAALWPDAPIYTAVYDRERMRCLGFSLPPGRIRTLVPAGLPYRGQARKLWTPLFPALWARLDLRGFRTVVSSSSFAAHQIRVAAGAHHICYSHSPPRFLYGLTTELDHRALHRLPPFRVLYGALRRADRRAASRVHTFVANSEEVRRRIRRVYGRESTVIYPPVDTASFAVVPASAERSYFLSYGRLVGSKRVDIAVEAANRACVPLVVAGTGPEEGRLRALAGPSVRFAGYVDAPERLRLLQGCLAVVFAAEEDFGMVPVEAMAAGRPVLAYEAGGALESVIAGETGEFFRPQSAAALAACLQAFDASRYEPARSRARAASFDRAVFEARLRGLVERGTAPVAGAQAQGW